MVTITDAPFEDIDNYTNGTVDIFTNYIYINNDSFEWNYNEGTSQNFELCFDVEAYTGTKTIRIYDGSTPNHYYDKSITTTPEHFRIVSTINNNKVYVDGELVATLNEENNSSIIIEFEGHIIKNYSFNNIDNSFKRVEGVVRWLKQWFYTKDEIDSYDTGWTDLTYVSGYANYGGGYCNLKVRRIHKLVEIRGVFKPTAQKTASTSSVQFATVPEGYRPTYQFRSAIQQGSGLSRWHLAVETNGKLCWSRYGTTSSANVPSGAWMCVHITYMIDG